MVKYCYMYNADVQYVVLLQTYRQRAGFSQDELAKIVGCSANAISSIELGHYNPDLEMLIKLSVALGCNFTDLVRIRVNSL